MSQQYYTLVTNIGAARIAKATALGTVVNLSQMAVGDGGGNPITPSATATALTREVYRASLNMLEVDENNQKQVIAELLIPEEEGDFTIREVGLFDSNNNLIAIGSIADSYKPRLSSGTASQQIIRMVIQIDNTDAVGLKVDPAVVLATREFVEQTVNKKFGNVAYRVPSIAALREFNKPGITAVIVENYHEGIAGGGGLFVADKSDKTSVDNGGTVIVSANGTRWRRIFSALSLYDFGFSESKNNAADILKLIDASVTNQDVDCLAQQFAASDFASYPKNNRYFNGRWKDGGVVNNMGYERPRIGNGRVLIGDNAGGELKIHESAAAGLVAIGRGAMAEMGDCITGIAIGDEAQGKSRTSRDNIAIGGKALENVQSTTWRYDQSKMEGTRNIAIGTNALISLTKGQGNVAIGRNAGQSILETSDNVVIGRNAMSGTAPFGFHQAIYNFYPAKSSGNVAIGANVAMNYIGNNGITVIGNAAAQKIKTAKNIVAIGNQAVNSLDINIAPNGGDVLWQGTESGSYTQSGKRLIVTVPNNHGAQVGYAIGVRLTSGAAKTLQNDVVPAIVTAVTGNNIEITSTADYEAEGTAEIKYVHSATSSSKVSEQVTAVGSGALKTAQKLTNVDAVGAEVMADVSSAEKTVAIGSYSLKEGNHVSTVAVGYWVAPRISTESCVFIGDSAGYRWQNTEIARGKVTNSIAIGALARVAGDNEIQIGTTGQTLYAASGVNVRSDLRDKADIAPLEVGLDFVKKLKPISGVYDCRDDYIDELFTDLPPDERAEKLREWWANPVKDGRHKQSQRHFWFGAQDIAVLEQEFGKLPMLDFRADTYSIEYEVFVPVLVKAIQEMAAELDRLKKQIKELKYDARNY